LAGSKVDPIKHSNTTARKTRPNPNVRWVFLRDIEDLLFPVVGRFESRFWERRVIPPRLVRSAARRLFLGAFPSFSFAEYSSGHDVAALDIF
jgi:hypothetical protein